jgi:hypothetical protein
MTNPAQTQATAAVAVIPTPSSIRPRRAVAQQAAGDQAAAAVPEGVADGRGCGSRRSARDLLDSALAGIRLGCRDSQFLSRLVHWDKRNAAAVASLLERARQAGRDEVGLTPRQREIVIAALDDAAMYRASGAAGTGCWDCEMIPGGRCAHHAKDNDRARAYAELAALLSGKPAEAELPRPRDINGYRSRTPVAS